MFRVEILEIVEIDVKQKIRLKGTEKHYCQKTSLSQHMQNSPCFAYGSNVCPARYLRVSHLVYRFFPVLAEVEKCD